MHDGQTVLFVASQSAALNVAYERLDKVGLDDICLELHSRAANKRKLAERLDCTLQAAAGSSATVETAKQLTAARDRLSHAAKRINAQIGDTAMTPHRALSIQIAAARRGLTPDARLVEEAELWTGKEFAEKAWLIERLGGLTESVGPLNSHVSIGVRRRSALQPPAPNSEAASPRRQSGGARRLRNHGHELFSVFPRSNLGRYQESHRDLPCHIEAEKFAAKIATSPSPRRIADATALDAKWLEQQAPYLRTFHPAAWAGLVAELRAPLAQGDNIFLYDNFLRSHDRLRRSGRDESESSNPFNFVEAGH